MNRFHPARAGSVYTETKAWKSNAYLYHLYHRGQIMRRSMRRVLEGMAEVGLEVQPLLDRADAPCRLEQAYPWLKTSWRSA
jgi:hypothetical protein